MIETMSSPIEITDSNFQLEVLDSKLPVLLDCWAVWCQPCKALSPIFASLVSAVSGRAKIAKLDVDVAPQSAKSLNVRGVPTTIYFLNGKEQTRLVGVHSRDKFVAVLDALIHRQAGTQDDDRSLDILELHNAIATLDLEKVREILTRDRTLVDMPDGEGVRPLSIALGTRRRELIDLVLSFEPEPTVAELAGLGRIDELRCRLQRDADLVDEVSGDGFTALTRAAMGQQVDAARVLLEAGANPDQALSFANYGISLRPIDLAVAAGDEALVLLLIDHGARLFSESDPKGATLLVTAARSGSSAICRLLVDAGADASAAGKDGQSALDWAQKSGTQAIIDCLSSPGR